MASDEFFYFLWVFLNSLFFLTMRMSRFAAHGSRVTCRALQERLLYNVALLVSTFSFFYLALILIPKDLSFLL